MSSFIKGLDLCESFFNEIAEPIIAKHFPSLSYSAGLIGYGSDVIGFDDETSTDHMWGPRFYLFLKEEDIHLKHEIMKVFAEEFPYTYKGYSVNFSKPDSSGGGIRIPEFISEGEVSPLVFVHTLKEYLDSYLGSSNLCSLSEFDWLAFAEHKLLTLTSGKIFTDRLKVKATLYKLSYYPENVWLFLIASNWSMISEEQAFVRRCHDVGDDIGSVLVCGRIAERLMRLSFLYCKRYAPYSKWFGKAFNLLPIEERIKESIRKAITAASIEDREKHIVLAQKQMAEWHNELNITDYVDVAIENYYDRNIKVIFADKVARAVAKKLVGTVLDNCPLIGNLSSVANFVMLSDYPKYRENIKALYGN